MITAEIKINGCLIGHIHCEREKQMDLPPWKHMEQGKGYKDGGEWYEYSYEYYRPQEEVIRGKVEHLRPNGAAALMKEIFDDIETKGGK